ncbi:hypothetical protein CR513_11130, partial [Mucuna pruriens]
MEHLPIHLPFEARVGGLVQYHWMYPFERFLHSLKNKVKNKARIRASICLAYLMEERSIFALFYYPSKIEMRVTCGGEQEFGTQFTLEGLPKVAHQFPKEQGFVLQQLQNLLDMFYTHPFSMIFPTCCWISLLSLGLALYVAQFGKVTKAGRAPKFNYLYKGYGMPSIQTILTRPWATSRKLNSHEPSSKGLPKVMRPKVGKVSN